ncbi:uncharacterized protein ACNLHF_012092 [Anomaloglossus baeobatrachus]|uniref:uncharacterized protein LOC142297097 n=1 Tax=Anomaloglossus baeobatrachus TaxID=238106 RepID=UPI003F504776
MVAPDMEEELPAVATEEIPPAAEEELPVVLEEMSIAENLPIIEEPPVVEEEMTIAEDLPIIEEPPVVEEEMTIAEDLPIIEEPPVVEEEMTIAENLPIIEEPPVVEEEMTIAENLPIIEEPPVVEEEMTIAENLPIIEEPPVVEEEMTIAEDLPIIEEPPVVEEEMTIAEDLPIIEEQPIVEEEQPIREAVHDYRTGEDEEPSTSTGISTRHMSVNVVNAPTADPESSSVSDDDDDDEAVSLSEADSNSETSEENDNEPNVEAETTEGENSRNTDEHGERSSRIKWSVTLRIKMQEAGLYNRHPSSDPILQGFSDYLQNHCKLESYKQKVENVSRFLYFMDKRRVSLNFAKKIEKARSFFKKLKDIGLCNQTASNYLKHVRRFVHYLLSATDVTRQNRKLYKIMKYFKKVIMDIQKTFSKGIAKEVVSKRYLELQKTDKTPEQCRALLNVAKPAFLQAIEDVKEGSRDQEAQLNILYYLEALIVLRHLLRPGVAKNMTVSEWTERMHYLHQNQEELAVVGVKSHKTAAQQVACFVLNQEEEEWFNVYFSEVRPVLATRDSPNNFFLSTSGIKIYNVSNDLTRYHKKYNVENISSKLVRKVCQTWTVSKLTEKEKYLFSKYLSHSNMTAERNYREKTLGDLCEVFQLVAGAGRPRETQPSTSRAAEGSSREEEQRVQAQEVDATSAQLEEVPGDSSLNPRPTESIPSSVRTRSTTTGRVLRKRKQPGDDDCGDPPRRMKLIPRLILRRIDD